MSMKEFLTKITSGRWIMTVAFTATSCYLAIKNIFPIEAFVGLVTLIANEYFKRSDRPSETNKGGTNV